jgi:hypothetical protein
MVAEGINFFAAGELWWRRVLLTLIRLSFDLDPPRVISLLINSNSTDLQKPLTIPRYPT